MDVEIASTTGFVAPSKKVVAKKHLTGRIPKSQKDPIQMYNKFGNLDQDMEDSEINADSCRSQSVSPHSATRSRSPIKPPNG